LILLIDEVARLARTATERTGTNKHADGGEGGLRWSVTFTTATFAARPVRHNRSLAVAGRGGRPDGKRSSSRRSHLDPSGGDPTDHPTLL
jgi:hypothetical protein